MSASDIILSAAGGTAADTLMVEDVFSTFLSTGNGSTQTITNGIDLSGKGGLIWLKNRSAAAFPQNTLMDTARGAPWISSNNTNSEANPGNMLVSYNTNGFTLNSNARTNASNVTYASWAFRKAPKFFDVVTYTGNGATQNISHNLGSVPGMMIVKRTDTIGDWWVYHRSLPNPVGDATGYITLNSTASADSDLSVWNQTYPTSSVFSVGNRSGVNANGGTFVAYLFAHDAGGFGAAGTDNIISCGSFTTDSNGRATVNLGYEPQFVLAKLLGTSDWYMLDIMRGLDVDLGADTLAANRADAELADSGYTVSLTSTGFQVTPSSNFGNVNQTYIYMAIRRPMKTPTTGTSVFEPTAYTGSAATPRIITAGSLPYVDAVINNFRAGSAPYWFDRLRGNNAYVMSDSTTAEQTNGRLSFDVQNGVRHGTPSAAWFNASGQPYVNWNFRRAPGFFDVVCYTGTGVARTVTHNLGVAPELMIVKRRSTAGSEWTVYTSPGGATKSLYLSLNIAETTEGNLMWNSTTPTSSVFSIGTSSFVNLADRTYVAYLFASCPGVSKVFSYTGNGSSQTINCGFSGGARLVLIKRTDSTGDWYIWDSSRGIVSGNDPRLSLNSTAAEVTSDDTIDPDSSGFVVNQVSATNVNVSSATYIGLAIA